MSGYWKFNSSLLDKKDFRYQLELILKWELSVAIIGNSWWDNLKYGIRSFAADYSRILKLFMVAEQRLLKAKLDRTVLAGKSGDASIATVEMASLQIKEHQALVVRARLKRMSCEATNMVQELRVEQLGHATNRHIASVSSSDG